MTVGRPARCDQGDRPPGQRDLRFHSPPSPDPDSVDDSAALPSGGVEGDQAWRAVADRFPSGYPPVLVLGIVEATLDRIPQIQTRDRERPKRPIPAAFARLSPAAEFLERAQSRARSRTAATFVAREARAEGLEMMATSIRFGSADHDEHGVRRSLFASNFCCFWAPTYP